MRFNHLHIPVRDLAGAVDWLANVWGSQPSFENGRAQRFIEPAVQWRSQGRLPDAQRKGGGLFGHRRIGMDRIS